MVYALIFVIALQAIIYHYERKDLYNRIMAESLADYKSEKPKQGVSAHKRVLKKWRGDEN